MGAFIAVLSGVAPPPPSVPNPEKDLVAAGATGEAVVEEVLNPPKLDDFVEAGAARSKSSLLSVHDDLAVPESTAAGTNKQSAQQ